MKERTKRAAALLVGSCVAIACSSAPGTDETSTANDESAATSSDLAQYNFESGTQGWVSSGGMITSVSSSTAQASAGTHSLAVNINGAAGTQSVHIPNASATPGSKITFKVWCPSGSPVSSVQPYALQGASGNWGWTGAYTSMASLQKNAWNTLSFTLPATAKTPLYDLGMQFTTSTTGSAVCYVDSVGVASTTPPPPPQSQDAGTGSTDSGTKDSGTGTTDAGAPVDAGGSPVSSALPAGWLFTKGNKIYQSNGASPATPWMARGVNMDDIFLCGYNGALWMTSPDQTLGSIADGLMANWKPGFVRVSLAMNSSTKTTSWLTNPAEYRTPMTNVINKIAAYPNSHVLVALRSDLSMIGHDMVDGDPEATGIPSDSRTTPNAALYPTGTDATYVALVDSFASSGAVMFGLTNEAGGSKLSNATIAAAMSHAVGVIRAEEDRLKVPHHIVAVQGNWWTSDISFYATAPLPYDNVVYEVHGYPPSPSNYTYANLPVIIGEYGSLPNAASFYADVEAKQIPNLAWDFEPYSNCAPDLLNVNQSSTNLVPSAWGSTVQSYLLAHPAR